MCGKTRDGHSDYSSGERSLRRIEFCCLKEGRDEHELDLGSDCNAAGGSIVVHLRDWPKGKNAPPIAVASIEVNALRGLSNNPLQYRFPSGDLRKRGGRRCGEDASRLVCSSDAFCQPPLQQLLKK